MNSSTSTSNQSLDVLIPHASSTTTTTLATSPSTTSSRHELASISSTKRLSKNKKKPSSSSAITKTMLSNTTVRRVSQSTSGMKALLKTISQQLKPPTASESTKSRNDYGYVSLYSTIRNHAAIYLFGDVHLELDLLFLPYTQQPETSHIESRSLRSEPRFTSFQYWRPCAYSEHRKADSLVQFHITPNYSVRQKAFPQIISLYKSLKNPLIDEWVGNMEAFQVLIGQLHPQITQFFQSLQLDAHKAAAFNAIKIQFHDQVKAHIQSLTDSSSSNEEADPLKKKYFVYYYGGVSHHACDFQIDHFGVSETLLDILGTNQQETVSCLIKYGLPYFMTQRTRIQRYMNDFKYLLSAQDFHEYHHFITLDDHRISAKMSARCYRLHFTPQQLEYLTPEMKMFLHIALHFRVDTYEFNANDLIALSSKRESEYQACISTFKVGFNSIIFQNELIEKYY